MTASDKKKRKKEKTSSTQASVYLLNMTVKIYGIKHQKWQSYI